MADLKLECREDSEEPGTPVIAKSSPAPVETSPRPLSPSAPGPSGDALNATASKTEEKSLSYFEALDAGMEGLQMRAQSLIDKINDKRVKDQTMMKDLKTSLNLKVADLCQCLEDRMYQLYEQNNTRLQAMLQELTDVIERIGHLQEELKQVCHSLNTVYKQLGLQSEM